MYRQSGRTVATKPMQAVVIHSAKHEPRTYLAFLREPPAHEPSRAPSFQDAVVGQGKLEALEVLTEEPCEVLRKVFLVCVKHTGLLTPIMYLDSENHLQRKCTTQCVLNAEAAWLRL